MYPKTPKKIREDLQAKLSKKIKDSGTEYKEA
jgi:hypothetical protein